MTPLVDPFGRAINYVRVSVTDRCDFRCVYCMSEDMAFLPKQDLLTLEELDRLCSAFVRLGTRKIRVTGGEPLVRRDIMSLFRSLSRHIGDGALDELTLTTNGSQLAKYAEELRDCGVERVNVSLDTLDPAKFRAITRWGDLAQAMAGIDAAERAGLKVKINAVALKGVNDAEAPEMVAWAHGRGFDLTFIEVMPLGEIETGALRPVSAADGIARRSVAPLHPRPVGPCQRRPGALFRRRRDRRPARLHHAAHPQFLRKLQPRARHLHGHALHVPGPGGRGRPARAAAPLRERRAAGDGDPRGDRPQAQGPRLPHRARTEPRFDPPPHERHGRLSPG